MLKYIRNIILRLLLSLHISYKKCHLPATLFRDEAVTNGWMDGRTGIAYLKSNNY